MGIVEVDNSTHCDSGLLRTMLVHTHMESLRVRTTDVHYKMWRMQFPLAMSVLQDPSVFEEMRCVVCE